MSKDDKKYVQLMDKYKTERLKDGKSALKYLDAAIELRKNGDVSQDAFLGGAYL
jgi:hypothetical protein